MKNTNITTARLQLHISAMDLIAAYNCKWSRDARDKRIDEAEEIFLNFEKAFSIATVGEDITAAFPESVRQRAENYSTRKFANG